MPAHGMAALAEAMSEHPRVTFEEGGQGVSVDSSRVVFILVSDVGADGVNAAVLRHRKRSDVVPVRLLVLVSGVVVVLCCVVLCICCGCGCVVL